ncbi:MAG: aspartate aminotransferase family protein [Desulfobacterales bacterium]|nr:aspartate aminotransferase family protein [Desulfobacterales bacterium]
MVDNVNFVKKHNYGTWSVQKDWNPLHIVDAEGCYFTDSNNNNYLDFSSQAVCSNLGHKNQNIIDAIAKQAENLSYVAPWFTTNIRAELSKLLVEVYPDGLNKFFFSTSGTEANEAAFKIARMYTGKYKIISRYSSYHGSTPGSISATGDLRRWTHEKYSKTDGFIFGPECNCYRCPFNLDQDSCNVQCVEYFDYMLRNEMNVAAIIIEPIVGTNGVLIPPDNYLPRLREICSKHNVLLIFDEVMTGWGRTGEWFACKHWNTIPDIITTAKGSTSAYAPLGITATSEKIASFFDDNMFSHGHTYESHPLLLATAKATIEEMIRLNINQNSTEMGIYLGKALKILKNKHKSIGDIRGKGLFWAVEIVKDLKTKIPFNTPMDKYENRNILTNQICKEMMNNGVYMFSWISHFILAPPLIISKKDIDFAVSVFDKCLNIADEML